MHNFNKSERNHPLEKYLDKEFTPAAMEVFRQIKLSFDPTNRFNPGKIIDL